VVRRIQVFIVRTILDEDKPDELRGEVCSATSGEVRHFKNPQEMLALIRTMQRGAASEETTTGLVEIQFTNQIEED
jgi:hypothetical protein